MPNAFEIPAGIRKELAQRVGAARADAAIAKLTAAAEIWMALLNLVTTDADNDGSDFFAYVNTLSHREMVETLMAGLTITKILMKEDDDG
jgi:hypothetical protein